METLDALIAEYTLARELAEWLKRIGSSQRTVCLRGFDVQSHCTPMEHQSSY